MAAPGATNDAAMGGSLSSASAGGGGRATPATAGVGGGPGGAAGRGGSGGSGGTGTGGGGQAGLGSVAAGGGGQSSHGQGAGGQGEGAQTYGSAFSGGQFHLGPVDWQQSAWHNACAPSGGYLPAVRAVEGELLAGLWNGIPDVAQYCDACIAVTTDKGKSALLRVVTYGDTMSNSIDVSPAAYAQLDSGEYPRTMRWELAKCLDTGPMLFEFQTGANAWWTSLWVRNARVPIVRVEVKSQNHGSFVALERANDGTLTDAQGFGEGPFTLRVTGLDSAVYEESFAWPSGGIAGQLITARGNFP